MNMNFHGVLLHKATIRNRYILLFASCTLFLIIRNVSVFCVFCGRREINSQNRMERGQKKLKSQKRYRVIFIEQCKKWNRTARHLQKSEEKNILFNVSPLLCCVAIFIRFIHTVCYPGCWLLRVIIDSCFFFIYLLLNVPIVSLRIFILKRDIRKIYSTSREYVSCWKLITLERL